MQTSDEQIKAAVNTWAASQVAGPRRLDELVTNVEQRDEVVERIATKIVRRELREIRSATPERRSTAPRADPRVIDPFAYSGAGLKAASEYVTQCAGCHASGLERCRPCQGTGNGKCPSCRGSGKVASPKTGRPIQCKPCKTTGVAPCRSCAGNGSIHCQICLGSGHQLAWLQLEESERWEVAVPHDSPIVLTHPSLRAARLVRSDELPTVDVVSEHTSQGPIPPQALTTAERAAVQRQLGALDGRLERVAVQQYLRVAAVRRDVTFEMCGTRATLALAGKQLMGATTAEARRPIRRRLYAWIALVLAVLGGGLAVREAMVGASAYFASARATTALLVALAIGAAIPALGTVLRSWRGGARFHRMPRSAGIWALAAVFALSAIPVVGLVVRPTAQDVEQALARHDVTTAMTILEALRERAGVDPDLADRVTLAQADTRAGSERLALLDRIAARRGKAAPSAAEMARTQRLVDVRAAIASGQAKEALALLGGGLAGDASAAVGEERARAHDTLVKACPTVTCRLEETRQAVLASPRPERTSAVTAARAEVLAALEPARADAADLVVRLQQLRALSEIGAAAEQLASDDPELQHRAHDARVLAEAARDKTPLLGNSLAVAEELFGAHGDGAGVPRIALAGVTVYLALDKAGRCRGVYAVGDASASRRIGATGWTVARLISQAVGRATPVSTVTMADVTSRWYASGTPVVVRWLAGIAREVRIGDATP